MSSRGGATQYVYDIDNRLTSITLADGQSSTYGYDKTNLIQSESHPGGLSTAYSYDTQARLINIQHSGADPLNLAYTYDDNGNRTSQTETRGEGATAVVQTTRYNYDSEDRLTEATYGDTYKEAYTYDKNFNRKTAIKTELQNNTQLSNKSYTYNNRNQLKTIADSVTSQSMAYDYDGNGNQTKKTTVNGGTTTVSVFTFNARDQLDNVTQDGTEQASFKYDHKGMRSHKTGQRGTEKYTWDGNSLLLQKDHGDSLQAHYEYGQRNLIRLNRAGNSEQYRYDALGSPVQLISNSTESAYYQYDAWGKKRTDEGTSFNRIGFTGHEEDKETGLIYAKARYYDPDEPRFISSDPFAGLANTPPSLHTYLYGYQNPQLYIDPDGRFPGTSHARDFFRGLKESQNRSSRAMQGSLGGGLASDLAVRSANALQGIGGGLFAVAGEALNVADLALDVSAANSVFKNTEVGRTSAKRVSSTIDSAIQAGRAVQQAVNEKGYYGATAAAATSAVNSVAKGAHDVFIKGDLEAGANLSGGVFTSVIPGAAGLKAARAGKAAKAPPTTKINKESTGGSDPQRITCACCFVAGTLVYTQDGFKNIEDIAIGDVVASRDEETKEIDWKPVANTFVFDDERTTFELVLTDAEGNAQKFEVTDNHPFWIDGTGWVDSGKLEAGMQVQSYDGDLLTVVSLTSLNESPVTYNFEVEGFHTYFVGESKAWVHNCDCDYSKLTAHVQGEKITDPHTNKVRDAYPGEKISGDHIYPKNMIEKIPGFEKLNKADQKDIVNDLGNVQPLPRPHNQSKSNRSPDSPKGPWEKSLGDPSHPEYKKNLEKQQLIQRNRLQDRIDEKLDGYEE